MNMREYQVAARSTAIYPNIGSNLMYPTLGLIGEFGELVEKFKKAIRDDYYFITESKKIDIIKESGDVFWYIASVSSEVGVELDTVYLDGIEFNIDSRGVYDSILILNNSLNEIVKYCKQIIDGNETSSRSFLKHGIYGFIDELKRFLDKMDIDIEHVLETNIAKLLDRKNRNVLNGSGDNR